jgi:hypothetical protein
MTAIVRLFAITPFLVYSASAFAIYKCEVQGRIIYSDEKCVDGKTTAIETANTTVSAAALNEAAERSRREKDALRHLQSSRHKEEAAEEKARQKKLRASEALHKKCQTMAMKLKWSEEDAADATGKSAEKARRTALRHREKYRAECGNR